MFSGTSILNFCPLTICIGYKYMASFRCNRGFYVRHWLDVKLIWGMKWRYFYTDWFDTEQRLTTSRHSAVIPFFCRIDCVAKGSSIPVVVRVSTVVAGVVYTSIRIHVILAVGMRVRRLRRPGLTLFTARCYRRVAEVLMSIRCRVAVTCTPNIQSMM